MRDDEVILLVEDNDADAELTMRALRRHHVANAVIRVVDGVEAIEFLGATGRHEGRNLARGPSLILLDLKLPKLSGHDVLRWRADDEVSRRIPVVVLTSSVEDRDLSAAYALGANSYVQKPVDFNEFAEAVAKIGLYWLLLNEQPNRTVGR